MICPHWNIYTKYILVIKIQWGKSSNLILLVTVSFFDRIIKIIHNRKILNKNLVDNVVIHVSILVILDMIYSCYVNDLNSVVMVINVNAISQATIVLIVYFIQIFFDIIIDAINKDIQIPNLRYNYEYIRRNAVNSILILIVIHYIIMVLINSL